MVDVCARRPVVRRKVLIELVVGDGKAEPVAEALQVGDRHLLGLVRDVARFDRLAERPALHGLGEDHDGCAFQLGRDLVSGVELAVVVPAAAQALEVGVGQVLDELAQPRVGTEEVLADVGAVGDGVALELAVRGRVHLVDEHAVGVAREQGSHSRPQTTLMTCQPAPRNSDSNSWITLPLPRTGPSSRCRLQLTTKIRLSSFSRDARVRAAVDSGSSISPSPTKHHTRCCDVSFNPARVKVAVEPSLVHRVDRAEPHRHRRELPVVAA